ncbi:phosphatidate cytidylyltransferase [Treponema sp. HNW]|uniref:phosphatidate cytidylyltransferase n=1 Tax=Treponema sp. HNW TaxID=3116654 RepID=UPI003D09DF28
MNKITQRLLTFFIGVPLVVSVSVISFAHHIILHCAIVGGAIIASMELHGILKHKLPSQPKFMVVFSSAFIPFIAALTCLFDRSPSWISLALIVSLLASYSYEIFSPDNKKSFADAISRLCSSTFTIVYIGFLLTYISRLTVLEYSQVFIALFFLLVFACDSVAWFFGMLFGKGNRGLIAVSPNKSIAGFLGGIAGTVAAALAVYYFFPQVFLYKPVEIVIAAACVALAAIAGDLTESVIKRSAECKDSGVVIPGRGGFLDSIDSILFSAPVYFIVINFFFV